MGEFREIKGDLIKMTKQGYFDLMGHGCNCFSTMGAGIALQVAIQLPIAYESDKLDKRIPIERLGDFSLGTFSILDGREISVLNLYSQYTPGRALDYEALTLCLRKVNIMFSGQSIGLPLIGCGIAGGDWDKVKEIIKRELSNLDVTIVHYHKNMVTELHKRKTFSTQI